MGRPGRYTGPCPGWHGGQGTFLRGSLYGLGICNKNYASARSWFKDAVRDGYPAAYVMLGKMYENGYGVERSDTKAEEMYEKGVALGDAECIWALGDYYHWPSVKKRNYEKAFPLLKRAAEMGHPAAMHTLGWMYEKGYAVQRDRATAKKWFRRAAALGDPNAKELLKRSPWKD